MKKPEELRRDASIYPNPAADEVQINGVERREIANVTIWTRAGHPIRLKQKPGGAVDVSKLARGLYSLVITCKDGSTIAKRISIRRKRGTKE